MAMEIAGDELSLSGLAARRRGKLRVIRCDNDAIAAVASSPEGAWAPVSSEAGGQSTMSLLIHGV
jgi:hypothetical protein